MKYEKIIQQRYCCVPACLQMILKRNNIEYKSQEEIGYDLGLIVPEEDRHLFNKVRTGEKPNAGYGTQIKKEEYSLNKFFEKNNIPLVYEYYYIEDYNEANQFLINNKENDIIVCVHCATLYDAPHADWGHVIVVDDYENEVVTLLEVSTKRDYEKIPLEKLLKAMKKHGKGNSAGFWLFKKINN